jgi:hypothetical protein
VTEIERTRASRKGCRTILDWLEAEGKSGAYAKQIVEEARRLLIEAEKNKRFPQGDAPPGMKTAEIILRSRPAGPMPDGATQIAWFALWLAVWVFRALRDDQVRYQAIELALEETSKGLRP